MINIVMPKHCVSILRFFAFFVGHSTVGSAWLDEDVVNEVFRDGLQKYFIGCDCKRIEGFDTRCPCCKVCMRDDDDDEDDDYAEKDCRNETYIEIYSI
jgi:hypothetical protein